MDISGKRLNQFGEYNDEKMTLETWKGRWQKGQTKFHMGYVHPMLEKHLPLVTNGKSNPRVFVPLCGKTVDMKWLSSQGFIVVGNEGVKLGCKQFFEENDIPYTEEPIGNNVEGTIFKSTSPDHDISIINCDFFCLKKEAVGRIDAIWDRGSLAAIDNTDREKYVNVIFQLMNQETKYLLDSFKLDNTIFAGPPHDCSESRLKTLFVDKCNTRFVEERDAMTDWQRSWGIDSFIELVHLITLK